MTTLRIRFIGISVWGFSEAPSIGRVCAFIFISFSAAGRLRAVDNFSPNLIVMQQLVVEATRVDKHPWLYVAIPDYEILSHCDIGQTSLESNAVFRVHSLDKKCVPSAYLHALAIPMSLIMFDHKPPASIAALAPRPISLGVNQPDWGSGRPSRWTDGCIDTSDSDTLCIVQNRWGMDDYFPGGMLGSGPTPRGLLFEISQCAPALPLWYQAGFTGASRVYRVATLYGDLGRIASALWISNPDTSSLPAEASKTRLVLPPIEDLFRKRGSINSNISPEWEAEAALFLRWGLFEQPKSDPIHANAFAIFCERSRTECVTESLFRECFGFGYSEMQSRLTSYLIDAAKKPLEVHIPGSNLLRNKTGHAGPVRDATEDEIGRILGDWMRMEGNSLRITDPATSRQFFASAGLVLDRAYRQEDDLRTDATTDPIRDPKLLAVYGMYEHDIGNDARGRELLTGAVKAKVARQQAYIDLAEIEFSDAQRNPDGDGAKFTSQQVTAVLTPILTVKEHATLVDEGYELIAKAWGQSITRPSLASLEVLKEGIGFYPFNSSLRLLTANVFAQWGYSVEAETIIDQGLNLVDESTANALLRLKASLRAHS